MSDRVAAFNLESKLSQAAKETNLEALEPTGASITLFKNLISESKGNQTISEKDMLNYVYKNHESSGSDLEHVRKEMKTGCLSLKKHK